ncbi:MAG TPA: aldo/keto reductase [Spirochaetota bacterium]|nr:aldo/keto reductase [Spirochaetota bacterium]
MRNLNSHPRFGLGCWPLCGKGWKGATSESAINLIIRAIELGVVFFDTAPVYGFGLSEKLLGEALDRTPSSISNKIVVATKCGLKIDNGRVTHDLSYDFILRDCEESLKRLNRESIELYQLHWPDPQTPLDESFKALTRLLDEGMVKKIGVCNFDIPRLEETLKLGPVCSSQNRYNFLQQESEELIDFCYDNRIDFIAYSPLAQGLLTPAVNEEYRFAKNDIRRLNPLFDINGNICTKPDDTKGTNFTQCLKKRNSLGDNTVKEALKFVTNNKKISRVLVGTSRTKHLEEILNYGFI